MMCREKAKWIKTVADLQKQLSRCPPDHEVAFISDKNGGVAIAVDVYEEGVLIVLRHPEEAAKLGEK